MDLRKSPPSGIQVFLGAYVHSKSRDEPLVIVPNGALGVHRGKIVFVDVEDNLEQLKTKHSFTSNSIYILGRGEFLTPGFVDTHIHAPQYPNSGLGLDLPLLEWLDKYTFPMETRFKDITFARSCYKNVVQRTLRNGTTTASYFATIHKEASLLLANIVEQFGQRALIGKVCMDSYSPETYCESTQQSLKDTEQFIIDVQSKNNDRVKPIITPRFALTCSKELMKGLGDLAKKYDVHIQTHLCESKPEIARAKELFPDNKNYTDVYHEAGLSKKKSIMAHCVHLTDEELKTIADDDASVSHCPTSNMCLISGLCPVRKLLSAGIRVGLGTDVSGGYTSSIHEAMRHAILTAKCLQIEDPKYECLTYKDVFYLATLGGAQALQMEKTIGNFEVGKSFDALHIDLASPGSGIHLFAHDTLNEIVQKFIMLGDDRNILQVYVDGIKVKPENATYSPVVS